MNVIIERKLKNYLFDSKIEFGVYLTLDKNKIETNVKQFKKYSCTKVEESYSNYSIKSCSFDDYTILTILEVGEVVNSQLLIANKEVFQYLNVKNLIDYVDDFIAELIISYFE